MPQTIEIPIWPHAYGGPSGRGVIRSIPEDFIVDELLPFEASGSGEHVFLRLEKTGENTEYVARQLARFAGVRQRDVGYAGLKDRHAVTRQWFSVWLPGKQDPDWTELESGTVKVLQAVRHARKLKRGVLAGNSFEILIRDWRGDRNRLVEQLAAIRIGGIPNYYGEQRFGHRGQNVNKALALFAGMRVGREQRSIYLSAARSYLFNQVLARRIADKSWNKPMPGDAFALDRSHSYFKSGDIDDDIVDRVAALDIHPTGVLWGKGEAVADSESLAFERSVIAAFPALAQGLVAEGVTIDRRALRVGVETLQWRFVDDNQLKLNFSLPAGSYATALLREIIEI